jgi:hypothetical protein
MKRIFLFLAVILVLLVACTYVFIPNKIYIHKTGAAGANRLPLFRNLSNETEWIKWWPGEKDTTKGNTALTLHGLAYKVTDQKVLSLPISITGNSFEAYSELTFLTISTDSTNLFFDAVVPTSYNPFKRFSIFLKANKLKRDAVTMMQAVNNYYSRINNLYGYDIKKERVVDSILIFTSREVKGYPSTGTIYSLVDVLKTYIKQQSASETNFPMLHILTKDSITYNVKVAIPVDKRLPGTTDIHYKWMLGGGNILITEVKGGNAEIQKAYKQVQDYISDFNRLSPAIPFQSLVTDRRAEPDSSKWITRIYYPVM